LKKLVRDIQVFFKYGGDNMEQSIDTLSFKLRTVC